MGYVQAGYSIVLGILFLYGLQLVWRRRRLNRSVARVVASDAAAVGLTVDTAGARHADAPGVGRPSGDR